MSHLQLETESIGRIKRNELIWAAGFFDGEGCAHVVRNHDKRDGVTRTYFRLRVVQVEREPLERFARAVGYEAVRGPYQQKNAAQRDYFTWQVAGTKAMNIAERLWPYLTGMKREQIERVYRESRT